MVVAAKVKHKDKHGGKRLGVDCHDVLSLFREKILQEV